MKGVFIMKKFVAVLTAMGVLAASMFNVAATTVDTDDSVFLKKNVIVSEDFEGGGLTSDQFKNNFGTNGANAIDGAWIDLNKTNNDGANAMTISAETNNADNKVLKMNVTVIDSSRVSGFSYMVPDQTDEYFIKLKVRRVDTGNVFPSVQVYHKNSGAQYRSQIAFNANTLNANWTTVVYRVTKSPIVEVYTESGGSLTHRETNTQSSENTENVYNYEQFKLFAAKSLNPVAVEIDDFEVYTMVPEREGVYFSQDFEGVTVTGDGTALSGVTDQCGLNIVKDTGIKVKEENGNKYLSVVGDGTTKPEINTFTDVNGSRLPTYLPAGTTISFMVRGTYLPVQFYMPGTDGKPNTLRATPSFTTKDGLSTTEWKNAVITLNGGGSYSYSLGGATATSGTAGTVTASNVSHTYLKFYTNASDSFDIDDIVITTPGLHTYVKPLADNTLTLQVVNGAAAAQPLQGILASFKTEGSKTLLSGASVSNGWSVPAYGDKTFTLDAANVADSDKSDLFLWDSFSRMLPLIDVVPVK